MHLDVPDLWMYDPEELRERFDADLATYLDRDEKYWLIYDIKAASRRRVEPDLRLFQRLAEVRMQLDNVRSS